MNLFLCLIWTALGLFLIVYHATTNDPNFRIPLPGNPSGGWLALILAAYNFIQWWARQATRRERERLQLLDAERQERLLRQRQAESGSDRDPNFQFTDDTPDPPRD